MSTKITRRLFLKNGTKGAAISLTVPVFLQSNVKRALAMRDNNKMTLQDYYNHFGIDELMINEIISAALSQGGDYCDVFFQHSISNYIGLEDKSVNRAYTSVDFGVGIRVLKGDQTGFSFTEELTPKAMKLAAKTAANIANIPKQVEPVEFKLHETPDFYPIKTLWEDVSIDKKIPLLEEINDKVFTKDSRIIKSNIYFSNDTSYNLIATSECRVAFD